MKKTIILAAFLALSIAGKSQLVSGTYLPLLISSSNCSAQMDSAHYQRMGNQVFVSGNIFISPGESVGLPSVVTFSSPFTFDGSVPSYPYGMGMVFEQVSAPMPPAATIGRVASQGNNIIFRWLPRVNNWANVQYYYAYTTNQ
jgi:hypothetical protein